jgi:hypothetical protein
MKIIAIDPGTDKSAFVSWDTEKDDFVKTDNKYRMGLVSNQDFYDNAINLIQKVWPKLIAFEMVQSYGLTVGRSTFQTVLFVGRMTERFRLTYAHGGLTPYFTIKYYGRPTIKAQIGGRNDAQVRASLRMRYGEAKKGEKLYGVKKDIWSALALAAALTEREDLKQW